MSRNIEDLDIRLLALYRKFADACDKAGIKFLVTCTYRSNAEQAKLYAQGRTTAGKIVTNAKAGQSKHNKVNALGSPASQAFDIAIMVNGKPEWSGKHPDWQRAGKIGEKVGLEWAGSWKRFRELPHFQLKEAA